jgi:hypothetical protein
MVQGAALKEKGVRTPVEAWRQTKRKQTETPELRVGVMVDISGSMGRAMEPMASTAWVMSEAVRRVQGKCAMVYYGTSAFATLKPGQHLNDVVVYTAPDGTEEFDKAFLALDGALNFTDAQNGARLLVVVSDGHYRHDQQKKAKQHIADANKAGTAVLWITFRNDGGPSAYLRGTDGKEVYFDPTASPADVATVIGQAAASALALWLLVGCGEGMIALIKAVPAMITPALNRTSPVWPSAAAAMMPSPKNIFAASPGA